jgi:hypothetical protein
MISGLLMSFDIVISRDGELYAILKYMIINIVMFVKKSVNRIFTLDKMIQIDSLAKDTNFFFSYKILNSRPHELYPVTCHYNKAYLQRSLFSRVPVT